MGRAQVYLGDEEIGLLERASRASGASRSELIRRAVRSTFGESSSEAKLQALRESAGTWRGSDSGAEYVDSLRGDMNERLARLGLR